MVSRSAIVLLVLVSAVAAESGPLQHLELKANRNERIIGGVETNVSRWPFIAALLRTSNFIVYSQFCGSTVVNSRSILTAAHCVSTNAALFRVRVGSTFGNSGGAIYQVSQVIIHPQYNPYSVDSDLAIFRLSSTIQFNSNVAAARFANYNVPDNAAVWAIGWGLTSTNGPGSERLREVQIWTVNQNVCASRMAMNGWGLTANMLCVGWLDVGGRGQCFGDSGSPLIHNDVVIGVCSWGPESCADPRFPTVNVRVSNYISWLSSNA